MVFYVQMLSNSTLHAYWFTSSAFKPFVAKIGSYILCRTVIGERVSRTQVYPVNKGHKRVTTGTRLCIGGTQQDSPIGRARSSAFKSPWSCPTTNESARPGRESCQVLFLTVWVTELPGAGSASHQRLQLLSRWPFST